MDLAASATATNPQQLTLPNTITDLDLLLPDPSSILGSNAEDPFAELSSNNAVIGAHTSSAKEITLPELQDSIEYARGHDMEDELANMGDDDLVLDTGEYLENAEDRVWAQDEYEPPLNNENDMSIEVGRDNEVNSDQLEDLALDLGDDPLLPVEDEPEIFGPDKSLHLGELDLMEMEMPSIRQDDESLLLGAENVEAVPTTTQKRAARQQKVKIDTATELKGTFIKDMQENRTGILSTYPTLPYSRDTVTLLNSYETTGVFDLIFRPTYMNEALSKMLEPELLPISPRKRKATDASADEDSEAKRAHMDESNVVIADDPYAYDDVPVIEDRFDAQQDEYAPPLDRSEDGLELDLADPFPSADNREVLVEDVMAEEEEEDISGTQAVNGISRNTREAANILITELSGKDKVDFQSLTVDKPRNKAVKLFFETLVLATKDAIAVEQKNPFGIIDISAKDGLFSNDWAVSGAVDAGVSQVAAV